MAPLIGAMAASAAIPVAAQAATSVLGMAGGLLSQVLANRQSGGHCAGGEQSGGGCGQSAQPSCCGQKMNPMHF